MVPTDTSSIIVDLNQFKLHIYVKHKLEVSLHFDSPSRRFYLAVLALIVVEMKKSGNIMSIPLENHHGTLALLNETVGNRAGSSEKEKLLRRIYRKWKGALSDLEFAPLFKVIGKRKEYTDVVGLTYNFTDIEKDYWANLFEYKGSDKNVRLKFSVDKLGLSLNDVRIVWGKATGKSDRQAWDLFIETLQKKYDNKSENRSFVLEKIKPKIEIKSKFNKKTWKRFGLATAVVLIVVMAMAFSNYYLRPNPSLEPASLNKMAFPLPDNPSIAVLPFYNLSKDPDLEYIADGITDNIITALSQVPKMFVIARNSVLSYKKNPVNVSRVSEELGVRYVLEGSVQGEKDQLRINVQLIDAVRGNHLWAKGYNRKFRDLFALHDEITIKVITALRVRLTKGQVAKIYTKGTENLETYLMAMKATELIPRFTIKDNRLARQLASDIIAIEPNWPNGYILLAWTHFVDARSGFVNSPGESLSRAEESARKALELDESLAVPHLILGKIHYLRKDWDGAIEEIELAFSTDPANIEVVYHYARLLVYAGRPEESIPLYQRAMRLDPFYSPLVNWGLGTAYFDLGRYTDAYSEFERYLERLRKDGHDLELAHIMMAANCVALGRFKEAQQHAKEILKFNPNFSLKQFIKRYPYRNQDDKYIWMEVLQKAGLG